MGSSKKTIIIIVVVAVVLIGAYFVFSAKNEGNSSLVATKTSALSKEEETTNAEFLRLLRALKGVTLKDSELISNPAFANLHDYGVTLTPENAGRRNPFAPLGNDAGGLFRATSTDETANAQSN